MKRPVMLALGATALALAAQEPADTHPPAGVVAQRLDGATLIEANVPGAVLDWAALDTDGGHHVYILASVEDDPDDRRSLFRVEIEPPRLVTLATDLDPAFGSLAGVDVDGDSRPELLLGRPGQIVRATGLEGAAGFGLAPLVSAPGLELAAAIPVRGAALPPDRLTLPSAGQVRSYGHDAASGWGLLDRRRLGVVASRHRHGLRLSTPSSTLLRLAGGDLLAVGPEEVGTLRLRSLLLPAGRASAPDVELWSRFPSPEQVQWSWFLVLDGRPLLAVTTNSADKLGVLERQRLHLFTLYDDRTQAGVRPWLTARTASRRWQRIEPFVADIDGDADEDLVVAQVDGLGSGKVRLEAFVNTGRRGFDATRRATTLERPPAGWHFGADLTADGLPDLVLLTAGRLEIYAGLPAGARRLVESRPRWSFAGADIPRVEHSVTVGSEGVAIDDERPSWIGRPQVLDLDGDGRGEVLLAENPQWGFGRLRIVFLPPA